MLQCLCLPSHLPPYPRSIMNYLHLPSSSRSTATAWNFPLGIEGFRYADLNRVRRLMALHQVFRDELRSADPALAERYEHSCDQLCPRRGQGRHGTAHRRGPAPGSLHRPAFPHRKGSERAESAHRRRPDRVRIQETLPGSPGAENASGAAGAGGHEHRRRRVSLPGTGRGNPSRAANGRTIPSGNWPRSSSSCSTARRPPRTRADAAESARCEERLRDVLAWAGCWPFTPN